MAFDLGDIFVTFKSKTDDLERGFDRVKKGAESIDKNVNGMSFKAFSTNASTSFGNVANAIQGVVTKVALFATTSSVGIGTFVKSAADLQQTSKSFEVLTGNVETANQLFAQLAKYANTTPFEFPQIAKAGQLLLGFGIESDKVFGHVQMLGDIAAATGADFESLALVFGQVNATGRLMGQDALQLINNKIPITTILAKKLGVSVQDVKEQMEKGQISVDLFNEALAGTTKKGGFAFQGVDVLAKSFNGRMSTLKDTVLEFGRNLIGVKIDPELGLVIEPGGIFDRLSAMIPRITASLSELAPKLKAAFDFLVQNGSTIVAVVYAVVAMFAAAKVGQFVTSIAALTVQFLVMTGAISSATAAQLGFNVAATANPAALVVAAVVALTGALVFLQQKYDILSKAQDAYNKAFEFFRDVIHTTKDKLQEFADFITRNVNGALQDFQDFIQAGRDLMKRATDTLAEHKQGLQDIATFLSLVLGPLFLKFAAQAAITWAQLAVAGARAGASWAAGAGVASVSWTRHFIVTSAQAVAHGAVHAVQAIASGAIWAAQALVAGGAWLVHFGIMTVQAVATGAVMVAQAAMAGAAWIVALGPVSIAIGAIAGAAFLIIKNWDTVRGWFVGFWQWFTGSVSGVADGIVGGFSRAASAITAPFKEAFNAIARFWNNSVGKLNFQAPEWVPGVGGKGWQMPTLPQLALGTNFWKGGLVRMNEVGPETAVLPKGTRVITADETRRANESPAGNAGNQYTINLNGVMARSESELADIMLDAIQAVDRRLSGVGKPTILRGNAS